MKDKEVNILLIGPCTNIDANFVGGATISFGYLVDYFTKHKVPFSLVNTKANLNRMGVFLNPLNILITSLWKSYKCDVIFLNSSRGGTKYLAPLLYTISKVFKKKFVFRPFGGDIDGYVENFSKISKFYFRNTILKSDLFLLQTKSLVNFYRKKHKNVVHLPTSRYAPAGIKNDSKPYNRKFIYLGFVNESKGVQHLIEAAKVLGAKYTVHIYGPIRDNYSDERMVETALYKGVIDKDQVLEVLSDYDVLVLPTYYQGEGYPGAIIEAYSCGIPVITTRWKAIPEIVLDGETGILIEPRNTEELIQAMKKFNQDNHKTYSNNARKYFLSKFEANSVSAGVLAEIKKLFDA